MTVRIAGWHYLKSQLQIVSFKTGNQGGLEKSPECCP